MAVTVNSFTGKYRVGLDPDSKVMLAEYIGLYSPQYLARLLGCELYESYLLDPLTPRMKALTEPFCIDVKSGSIKTCIGNKRQYVSEGIGQMLKGFIYFHFVPDSRHKITTSGPVVNKNENSTPSDLLEVATTDRYNRAVQTYQAIQFRIKENETDYPEFNGLPLRYLFYGGAF